MPETNLNQIIEMLIILGEDRDELKFWQDVFPSLAEHDQQELLNSLQAELKELQATQ